MGAPENALVIVESPTKAKTIRKYLGSGYTVEASMGHVRDLPPSASDLPEEIKGKPWARLAVDVENGFQPVYVVPKDKKKIVAELRKALKGKDVLYLATDEDREGEAIGWHLVQLLKPKVPVHRLVFHEITEDAIQHAINSPRPLNEQVVNAQEARRILDRLVGYEISPLLWKKVAPGLSAGRVQSVAVRLLVLRERERRSFVVNSWWDLRATFAALGRDFTGQLVSMDGQGIASGKDFDEKTGGLKSSSKALVMSEEQAQALTDRIKGEPYRVLDVEQKIQVRRPYPPFTTSTLQQEANRKLGFAASRTMQVAQRLYENGHITYMRTDSFNLAEAAVTGIRNMVQERYGKELVSPKPRRFSTKSKGAQEAHEAIRPAGTAMATSAELGLSGPEAKLYELIWKRTVSTQMADAKIALTTAKIETTDPESKAKVVFRSSGRQVVFPGFFRAYVEGSDDPDAVLENKDQPLPKLEVGDPLDCKQLEALGHETRPPSRYTVATLVKALETKGIGRPSTYASIIDTIQRRGYVRADRQQLIPTFTAMAVTKLLEQTLGRVMDIEFTASMEAWLDEIALGGDAKEYLGSFYQADLMSGLREGEQINARSVCTLGSERIAPFRIRLGRFGPFVEYDVEGQEKPRMLTLPEDVAPADVDIPFIEALMIQADKVDEPLGIHPETKENVYVKKGRFGPFVQLGEKTDDNEKPKRASLPPGYTLDNMTFEVALEVLKLPRPLGDHPDDGEPVRAAIGRYGPYVAHGKTFASLKAPDDVLTVELPRALELIAARKEATKKPEALREIGVHPDDGEKILAMDGRYGPYIKHGKTNATIPKDMKPEDVTLEKAIELIAERRKRGKGRRRTSRGGGRAK